MSNAHPRSTRLLAVFCFSLGPLALTAGAAAEQPLPQTHTFRVDGVRFSVRYPKEWSVAPERLVGLREIVNVPPGQEKARPATARVKMTTERRTSHDEAVQRLGEIGAGEAASPSEYLVIGGWPAVQLRRIERRPQPNQGPQFADEWIVRVRTAVAAGTTLLRLEAVLPSDASEALIAMAEAIGRSVTSSAAGAQGDAQADVEALRAAPPRLPLPSASLRTSDPLVEAGSSELAALTALPGPGLAQRVITGRNGELEIAVSPNGQNIVIGQQSLFVTSNDGGQTFPFSGFIAFSGGDPSLAIGRSGNFYYAGIRGGCQPADAAGPAGYTCTGMARSINTGQTFPIIANAVVCPNQTTPPAAPLANACFPDQEHIAADGFNAGTGGDQVYSVWRNFDSTDQDPAIVCSQDSGVTWTAPLNVGTGAFPRVGVGQDGLVYVAYLDGGNYMINKFSSCRNGLAQQPTFPKAVATRTPVVCPFVGHDRCDQNPSSQMVAVDDTNPNHVYYAFAEAAGAGNENIIVRDSVDGGVTWPGGRVVQVNAGIPGKRIMPWLCTTGGLAYLSWYDRRSAPPTANDLTDYYAGSVGLDQTGNLVAVSEFKITEVADPWCASGWGCGTRSVGDAEQCSTQPQLAGTCVDAMGNAGVRCDFSDCGTASCGAPMGVGGGCQCNAGETCQCGDGCPKYGDYNGNACAAGRLYAAWASAVSPPGIVPPSNSIDIFFNGRIVGDVPQIQVPGSVSLPDTCVGTSSTATLNVCNTGQANLEVNSIGSSSAQFAVTTPSSGYPVVISPDFCFPFQVRFAPSASGPASATLTIRSNDPSTPTVQVLASGRGTEGDIRITGSTAFGDVCAGALAEQSVSVCNVGLCTLNVSSAAVDCPDFTIINNPFPAPVSPDSCIDLVIRFTATSGGPKSCTLTIQSDDPDSPVRTLPLTANTPSASIDVPPDQGFAPTVVQTTGACVSTEPFPVSNTGTCPLRIASIAIGGTNGTDFSLSGLPSFPIILEPGHVAGEGDLRTVFAPTVLDRDRQGTVSVTYVSESVTGATTTITRALCGEGVRTGARILVRAGGQPIPFVESIQLGRISGNKNKDIVDSNDVAKNLALQTVTPAPPCPAFQFHREYGTVSNPIQLLPGSYRLTAAAIVNGKHRRKTVAFDVSTCTFNPTVVVDF